MFKEGMIWHAEANKREQQQTVLLYWEEVAAFFLPHLKKKLKLAILEKM